MGGISKLTEQQLEDVARFRERGWSCASIAKRMGVSTGAINYQCLRMGVISPNQRGRTTYDGPPSFIGSDGRTFRRFTEADDAEMVRLAAEGLKVGEIARRMGRANTSIRMRMLLLGAHEEIAA